MVELRREILFPTAQLTRNGNIVTQADRKRAVDRVGAKSAQRFVPFDADPVR